MSWDRATIESEIQNEVDDFESDSLTIIRQAINDIGRILWFRHDWSFRTTTGYITTDGSARAFTIASSISNWSKILAVGFKGTGQTTYQVLEFVPYSIFLEQRKNIPASSGDPTCWTLFDGQIILDSIAPAVSSGLEVTYEKVWVDLTAADSEPLIPEKYKHVIKSGVKAMFWDSDDDVRASGEWVKFQGPSYKDGVGGMIGDMILEDNEQKVGPHQNRAMGRRSIIFGRR